MRKFLTLFVLFALLTPLFLLNASSARADNFPNSAAEDKKKPKEEPTPTPRPKPKPGPKDGGADD